MYPDAKPPLAWSAESNVVWKAKLPGWSNASPLILGKQIYVCVEPNVLACLSLKDGAILWTRTNAYPEVLAPEEAEKVQGDPKTHDVNGYSSPTPATDGAAVYVVFGNGLAACYDPNGQRKWAQFIEKPTHGWGHSASPVFAGGKLIVHILKVTALDPATGKVAWRADSDAAWGSPVQARIGSTPVVVTASGDILRASDGRVLAAKVSGLTYATPVVRDNIVYFIQKGGRAIRLPAEATDAIQPETLWTTEPKDERYYASPVVLDGLIYAVTQHGDWSVIDAATGAIVYTRKLDLGGTFYPSVTLAGKLLFVSSDSGKTVMLQPGREYKEVATCSLESFRSTPVFIGKRVYVRSREHLWCLGE